jgi:hypothetical protein
VVIRSFDMLNKVVDRSGVASKLEVQSVKRCSRILIKFNFLFFYSVLIRSSYHKLCAQLLNSRFLRCPLLNRPGKLLLHPLVHVFLKEAWLILALNNILGFYLSQWVLKAFVRNAQVDIIFHSHFVVVFYRVVFASCVEFGSSFFVLRPFITQSV